MIDKKKARVIVCACACAVTVTAASVAYWGDIPVFAENTPVPVGTAVAGINIPLNNYYASSLNPEKEIKEFLQNEITPTDVNPAAESSQEAPQSTSPLESASTEETQTTQAPTDSQEETTTQEPATQPPETQEQTTNQDVTESAIQEDTTTQGAEPTTQAPATQPATEIQPESESQTAESETEPESTEEETEEPSPYENIAITRVKNFVNIRDQASTEGEVVGKIYNNAAATILEVVDGEDGEWYYIKSGSVKGYMKAEFFVTGKEAEAIAREVGTVLAKTTATTLRLREEPSVDSRTLTLLANGEIYSVKEEDVVSEAGDHFIKVLVNEGETEGDSLMGYISADYAEVFVEFEEAISIEEELEEIRRQEELKREEEEAKKKIAEAKKKEEERSKEEATKATKETKKENNKENNKEDKKEEEPKETKPKETQAPPAPSSAASGATRDAVVARAKQFVGNLPYVWSGTSLSSGVDCSGFVYAVFREYGISVPRDSRSQAAGGQAIGRGDLAPGDLVFYANSGGTINHVGIYIGGGQIVHAANKASGVKISSVDYASPVKYARYIR